jgi:hypothetical protein
MKRLTLALFALTSILTVTATAEAQYHPCCWGYRVRYYRVQPAYHLLYRAPQPPRWSVGLHATGLTSNQMFNDEPVVLGGLGGHLRYRGYRWGGEVSVAFAGGENLNGAIQRLDVPVQLSALLYLVPEGRFNLFLLGGARVHATRIQMELPNLQESQTFAQFGFHGGAGAEIVLGQAIALTGDVRFYGLLRDDNNPAGRYYEGVEDGLLKKKSVGVQFNFGVNFRF